MKTCEILANFTAAAGEPHHFHGAGSTAVRRNCSIIFVEPDLEL
jgi:hypothetical protein